jgi:hypothetical protein
VSDANHEAAAEAFLSTYSQQVPSEPLKRPVSLFQREAPSSKRPLTPPQSPVVKKVKAGFFGRKPAARNDSSSLLPYQQSSNNDGMYLDEQQEDQLRQEAALLTVRLQSDLDSVQKVEASMTEITQLLSQFSSLVSEQQEDIQLIHDTAVSSKENVNKGQESLIDATERTKRSKHYMATFICGMALILLFFNSVTP